MADVYGRYTHTSELPVILQSSFRSVQACDILQAYRAQPNSYQVLADNQWTVEKGGSTLEDNQPAGSQHYSGSYAWTCAHLHGGISGLGTQLDDR